MPDNNAAERALRPVALGRKNYLFAGSDAGGERAAAIYSLIGSAKLNGLDPEAYLREVLSRNLRPPYQPDRGTAAVEHRRKPAARKARNRVAKDAARQKPHTSPCEFPNITDLIDYGDITVGVLRGVGCAATAADEDRSLAALLRRPGESLLHLLTRLDQAIDKAYNEDVSTDQINPPPKRP